MIKKVKLSKDLVVLYRIYKEGVSLPKDGNFVKVGAEVSLPGEQELDPNLTYDIPFCGSVLSLHPWGRKGAVGWVKTILPLVAAQTWGEAFDIVEKGLKKEINTLRRLVKEREKMKKNLVPLLGKVSISGEYPSINLQYHILGPWLSSPQDGNFYTVSVKLSFPAQPGTHSLHHELIWGIPFGGEMLELGWGTYDSILNRRTLIVSLKEKDLDTLVQKAKDYVRDQVVRLEPKVLERKEWLERV